MRQIISLMMVMMAMPLFGGASIRVDDIYVNKSDVMHVVSDVYKLASQRGQVGREEEKRIIEEVVRDYLFWGIARKEMDRRNLTYNNLNVSKQYRSNMCALSKYSGIAARIIPRDVDAMVEAREMLRRDGRYIPANREDIVAATIKYYAPLHQIEVADYSNWKVNREKGWLIQSSDYNALEHEIDDDTNGFIKAIYYVHHYTIRYYVIFIRWYIHNAQACVDKVKAKGNATATKWMAAIALYIIPYLFHVVMFGIYLRLQNQRVRFFRLLIPALALSGVSTILFYFGMSPWSLFFVCVIVPLMIIVGKPIWEDIDRMFAEAQKEREAAWERERWEEEHTKTIFTTEDGEEYAGKGKSPSVIESTKWDETVKFDKVRDGVYKERNGDRIIKKRGVW